MSPSIMARILANAERLLLPLIFGAFLWNLDLSQTKKARRRKRQSTRRMLRNVLRLVNTGAFSAVSCGHRRAHCFEPPGEEHMNTTKSTIKTFWILAGALSLGTTGLTLSSATAAPRKDVKQERRDVKQARRDVKQERRDVRRAN